MANDFHTGNHTSTMMAVSSSDGKTPVTVYADPTTHRILTNQLVTTNGNATAQTTTNSNVTQVTVGAADATYLVCAAVYCSAYTSGNLNVTIAYTDVGGNAITLALQGHFSSGYGINMSGTGNFECQAIQLRAKATTTVTITTTGTFNLTYNIYGTITQLS